ncbi:hypothetical protein AWB89_24215 [Mycobacterium paraense]|nr:hypothetical protein AWB89_24215 [Mycobacterium paraense]
MDEVIADATATDFFAAPMGSPPATVRDAAELFDIDVHQFTRTSPLVAHRGGLRRLDQHAGHRVAVAQIGFAAPAQDAPHGAGRDAQLRSQPVLASAVGAASRYDLLLNFGGRAPR